MAQFHILLTDPVQMVQFHILLTDQVLKVQFPILLTYTVQKVQLSILFRDSPKGSIYYTSHESSQKDPIPYTTHRPVQEVQLLILLEVSRPNVKLPLLSEEKQRGFKSVVEKQSSLPTRHLPRLSDGSMCTSWQRKVLRSRSRAENSPTGEPSMNCCKAGMIPAAPSGGGTSVSS